MVWGSPRKVVCHTLRFRATGTFSVSTISSDTPRQVDQAADRGLVSDSATKPIGLSPPGRSVRDSGISLRSSGLLAPLMLGVMRGLGDGCHHIPSRAAFRIVVMRGAAC